jgi:predicted metal-binding protein
MLFRKYDVIEYNALNDIGDMQTYKAFLCRKCADVIDDDSLVKENNESI